jgi:hypothetical protein
MTRVWCVLLLVTGTSACATLQREPWVLDSGALRASGVRRVDWVASWPQALATVLEVFERDLGLPRLNARLVFLPDDRRFEQLLLEVGYAPALARDTVQTMTAIGGHQNVLINEARVGGEGWTGQVALLAHELTHVLQYQLGGGTRGQSDQWLREGFADWVEMRVLEELGAVEAARARTDALRRLRAVRPERLPPLAELATFPDWVKRNQERPGGDLYAHAQVAVSVLVEQRGAGRVIEYFERFAARQARAANFEEAFGESVEAFDRRFRAYVWPGR